MYYVKKFFKFIGITLLVLLILFIIATVASIFYQKSAQKKDRELLEKDGYVNLVSAGDYNMNINTYGEGKHKIIAMPGQGDGVFAVDMKKFSEYLGDDVTIVAVSRPGYGLSEDTDSDITTEFIVDSTRTALKNAGIEAPYILMPHSISGVYATYWESTYPDEIEGVVFLDSTYESQYKFPEEGFGHFLLNAYYAANKFIGQSGLGRAYDDIMSAVHKETRDADDNDSAALAGVSSPVSVYKENKNLIVNMKTAWASIKSNDIPKVYIDTDYKTLDDVKEYLEYEFGEVDEEMVDNLYSDPDNPSDWKIEQDRNRDEYIKKLGNCKLVNIPGSHWIYGQKPDECAKVINELIKGLE